MIKFGPAGNSDSFYAEGHKTTLEIPHWLYERDLNAYEYQCTRGVRVSPSFANALKVQAERFKISLSIHAPYFVNLSSPDPEVQVSSQKHLLKSLQAAKWMGATRVVFHPGSASQVSRGEAMKNAAKLLEQVLEAAEQADILDAYLCPETMGKTNQLGTLSEVIELCKLHNKVIPTVDFGHIHALGQGSLTEEDHFYRIIEGIDQALGREVVENLHCHFSPVEYAKGGEKKHMNVADKDYGPDFYPFAKVLVKHKLTPTIICESAGHQAEDALSFMRTYNSLR